jgi:hypothetical protein
MAHGSTRVQPIRKAQDIDLIQQIWMAATRQIGALRLPIHW